MMRAILGAGVMASAVCAAFGQSADGPPAFEVASIKPAAPAVSGRMMIRMGGDPGGWTTPT